VKEDIGVLGMKPLGSGIILVLNRDAKNVRTRHEFA